jgi:hypothetical protein
MERKERNAEGKTSACQITSFISAMFYFRYLDLARNMSEKYSFECVKFYISCLFLQLDNLLTLLLWEYFLTAMLEGKNR